MFSYLFCGPGIGDGLEQVERGFDDFGIGLLSDPAHPDFRTLNHRAFVRPMGKGPDLRQNNWAKKARNLGVVAARLKFFGETLEFGRKAKKCEGIINTNIETRRPSQLCLVR